MGATSMARGGVTTRFLTGFRRELGCDHKLNFSSYADQQRDTSFGDVEFEFLEYDGEMLPLAQSASSDDCHPNEMELLDEDDGERGDSTDVSIENNRSFWDNQHQVLQVINGHSLDYFDHSVELFLFFQFLFI